MMPRSSRRLAAACLTAAVIAGACTTESPASQGDDRDEPTAQASDGAPASWDPDAYQVDVSDLDCTAPAPDPHRGITDDTVAVGSLTTESGPTTSLWGDAVAGAEARIARANAEGGVHGRRIEMVARADDGLDANRSVDAARRLAQKDEVFAVVPAISLLASFSEPLCDAVVPYFGWGFTTAYCESAVAFGFNGCLVSQDQEYPSSAAALFGPLLEGTDNTIALVGNDDPSSKRGLANLVGALEADGFDVVSDRAVLPSDQPLADPGPVVNDIMTANDGGPPAAVWYIADFANTSTMTQAMSAAGFEGRQFNSVSYDPRLAGVDYFEGSLTTLQWLPFEAADENEFVAQMADDLRSYDEDLPLGIQAAAGYISADMFVAGLEATGRDLTVDSFLATLNSGDFSYDPPGLFGGSYWPESHLIATPCGTVVRLEDGAYELATPLACGD